MLANRFNAVAAKRRTDRAFFRSPNHKIAHRITRLREAGTNYDLIVYEHPTKGRRTRRWLRGLPTFASKNDMVMVHIGVMSRAQRII